MHQSTGAASACALTPSESLRQSTAAAHQSVEHASSWADIFASVDSYALFLGRLLRSLADAEAAVEPYLATAGPWAQERRRAVWVEDDLRFLSTHPGQDESGAVQWEATAPHDFRWVKNGAQAAGICYVLEGSALGGVYLARQAQQALGLQAAGTRYLSGNGARTIQVWRQVTEWLDRVLQTPAALRQAQQAADAMFAEYELIVRSVRKVN